MSEDLDELVAELEGVADRLRAGDVKGDEAATLVDRCAELAARVGSALEERGRAGEAEGQERLL